MPVRFLLSALAYLTALVLAKALDLLAAMEAASCRMDRTQAERITDSWTAHAYERAGHQRRLVADCIRVALSYALCCSTVAVDNAGTVAQPGDASIRATTISTTPPPPPPAQPPPTTTTTPSTLARPPPLPVCVSTTAAASVDACSTPNFISIDLE